MGNTIKPLLVGLTGGIGSGKTTVVEFFCKLGVPTIDADDIARKLVMPGHAAYHAIIKEFGTDVVDQDGNLQRDYLRALVFNNKSLRKQLESIIHPLVRSEINNFVNNVNFPYCIICIPLLFETGANNTVDRILVIDLPELLQIDRASKRDGVKNEDTEKIMASQVKRQQRLQGADDIIHNDKNLVFLQKQVNTLHQKYLDMAKHKK